MWLSPPMKSLQPVHLFLVPPQSNLKVRHRITGFEHSENAGVVNRVGVECVHDLQRHFKTLSPFIAAEFHPHFVGWNNRSMPSESVGTEKSIVLLIILCTSTPDAQYMYMYI